ncbi:hypothetical protein SK854_14555 [Lentzea sp. BCCO 10_0061]|uniref:Uncharacterized protein n=1 Tax=Lentzea sokolovensis TaxID=3095429 RepID=A0ABU4UV74_9PSEU|nr:hypothetical protein [Lentzea sp. BCCO 10_0061]MDX8143346.1 hypothetical protein [Lentzea sp. BCCO 10_0061]
MIVPDHATRETVELVWQAVLDGTLNRAAAHRWAARWVEADDPRVDDPMVWSALVRVHGFGLVWTDSARTTVRHGGAGVEVHSSSAIEEALATWRAACANRPATTT